MQYVFCTDYNGQLWNYTLDNIFSLFLLAHRNNTLSTSSTTLRLTWQFMLLYTASSKLYIITIFYHFKFQFHNYIWWWNINTIPSTTKSACSPQHKIQLHTIAAVTYTVGMKHLRTVKNMSSIALYEIEAFSHRFGCRILGFGFLFVSKNKHKLQCFW